MTVRATPQEGHTMKRKPGVPPRRLALTAIAMFPLLLPAAAGSQGQPGGKIEIAEAGADPGYAPTFNQELKLRLRVVNNGPAAKGAFVEARQGATPLKRADLGAMGAGEQRTITLSTGLKLGTGESCLNLVPGAATDSAAPGGGPKQICLTPACYKVSDRPSM